MHSKLNQVDELQTLEESSVDFYALLRSVTDQKRQAELREALELLLAEADDDLACAGSNFVPSSITAGAIEITRSFGQIVRNCATIPLKM